MVAKRICEKADARIKPQVVLLADQVIFMAQKLKETKRGLKDQPIVIPYDNGGGQSGIRENPAFAAYERLLATYIKSLATLKDLIGDEQAPEIVALESLRGKFKLAK